MNVQDKCNQIIKEIDKSKAESEIKLEQIKIQLKELAEKLANIEQPNRWEDLNDLRSNINAEMLRLKKRSLNSDLLEPLKVLEARQDITMWVTKGEASIRMIDVDINNKDSIRLKAWLSINQENLNTNQRFNRQPLEDALINSLFEEEQNFLKQMLSTIEGAMNTQSIASRYIDSLKSSIKSNGLAQ